MILKKTIVVSLVIFLSSSLLLSQSLVDLAKKEKERRESLTRKSSIIVTNDDLKRVFREEALASVPIKIPPQQSLDLPPARKIPAQKIPPAQQVENLDQAGQIDTSGYSVNNATQVLDSTQFVENPQWALDKPDGKFAEIGEFGFLDLEIDVKNRRGNDIAIYARRLKEGFQSETMNFAVFVELRGEWEFIGFGGGNISPEAFDLGDVRSAKKVRIIFKDFTQDMWLAKPYRLHSGDYSIGIDAIEALHR